MASAYAALLADFRGGPAKVAAALERAEPVAFARKGSEGWSARHVVVHLSDAEVLRALRLRLILSGGAGPLPLMDENAWFERLAYDARDWRVALAHYEATVAATADLVGQFGDDDWLRAGTHPTEGDLTVLELITRGAAHASDHAAQVSELLRP